MAEWTVCAECGNRYESPPYSFCPKCGSTARAGPSQPGGVRPTARRDPARMRVQLGGIVLLTVAALSLASTLTLLANPESAQRVLFDTSMESAGGPVGEGGAVHVRLVQDGAPVAGANVTYAGANGTFLAGRTDAGGWHNATLGTRWAAVVNVTWMDRSWTREVLAPGGVVTQLQVDAAEPARVARVVGGESLWQAGLATATVLAGLMALGGLAAVLVRWRGLALAGPLPVLALLVLLLAASPQGGLLLAALVAVPYVLVATGGSAFRRR